MSYSTSFIGKPSKVATALTAFSETISGKSKEEYDAALPHIVGIVNQNSEDKTIRVMASGHAFEAADGMVTECKINVEVLYGVCV